ncbi:uncharacterized protein H6S33_004973 [Morchella sextelata]|uniref:uncharacterized protein n=1 Tax=Morchella sextelata TaxID=1174677 RepID=UPI001D03AD84|nr:uncharacterized protein H6S33_004973 [Morchella sextelata]KAH0604991.1 hypothetical protein H6S33_004973 [Morchella sextelata]
MSIRSNTSNTSLMLTHSSAQAFEHAQRTRLHAAASAGDISLFDLEMRSVSLAAHGPSLPPTRTPPATPEHTAERSVRLEKERAYREVLLTLVALPVVPGLVHPLDSARANIALSRPWPHPNGRTVADEKWMWEILRYWAKWPVMSVAPLQLVVEEEGEGMKPLTRRGTWVAMGKGVIGRLGVRRG